MKKLFLASILTLISVQAMAQDAYQNQKIQVVKTIYANGASLDITDKYTTQDFKSVFAEDERNTPEGELGCIDYDVFTQSQDTDTEAVQRTLKVSALPNGNIQAQFKNYDETVKLVYVMKCYAGGKCLVDDILHNGESFKRSVRQCIKG